jgi:hypothetical protein
MENNYDLTKFIKKYKGLWIALDSQSKRVLSSGENAVTVYRKAKEKDNSPTLFKVPVNNIAFAGKVG